MDFCLFAYSDEFHVRDAAFDYLAAMQELSSRLDVKLTHIHYSLVAADDGEGHENDDLQGEEVFDAGSLERLKNALKEKPIKILAVWSREGIDETSPDNFHSEMDETQAREKKLYVQFPMERVENLEPAALFSLVRDLLSSINRLGRLDYAFVTLMKPQLPQTYFLNIFAPGLEEPEAINLAMWIFRQGERRARLKGLYWGNLLGREHLLRLADMQAFKQSLEKIVGGERLAAVKGEGLFFMLPGSDPASSLQYDAVRRLLIENDLLMQPSEEDVKRARWLLSF